MGLFRVGTLRFAHPTGGGGAGGAEAGEQVGSGFVGWVLRDQFSGEGVLEDGLAQGGGAGEFELDSYTQRIYCTDFFG